MKLQIVNYVSRQIDFFKELKAKSRLSYLVSSNLGLTVIMYCKDCRSYVNNLQWQRLSKLRKKFYPSNSYVITIEI
jgi:hypothetical protein